MLVELCPASISACASVLRHDVDCRPERSLWQLANIDGGTTRKWEKIDPAWKRKSILLPLQDFCGPVGTYKRMRYKFHQHTLQTCAVQLFLLEAQERHHFDGRCNPFHCPEPTCEAYFKLPGEWSLHAIDTGHDRNGHPTALSDETTALFDQHKKALEHIKQQDVSGALKRMREDWGEVGSQKRHTAERTFLYQLERDPLYAQGKSAQDSLTWFLYRRHMDPECW